MWDFVLCLGIKLLSEAVLLTTADKKKKEVHLKLCQSIITLFDLTESVASSTE